MKLRRRPHGRSVPPRCQNGHCGGVGCKPAQARRWDLLPVAQMTGGFCGAGSRRLPLDHARHSTRRRTHLTSTLSRCPAGEGRHSRQPGGMGACNGQGEIECRHAPQRLHVQVQWRTGKARVLSSPPTCRRTGGESSRWHCVTKPLDAGQLVMTHCPWQDSGVVATNFGLTLRRDTRRNTPDATHDNYTTR